MGGRFGRRAIELSGIVIDPAVQGQRIGTRMVAEFMRTSGAARLTAYSRNPAILKLIGNVCGANSTYPITVSDEKASEALAMPDASLGPDGIVYHIGRYAYGLYGGDDPADCNFGGTPMKTRYPGLQDLGTALVIIADYPAGGGTR